MDDDHPSRQIDQCEHECAHRNDDEATVKRYYPEGEVIRFQPANAAMQPIFADPDQVQIQGVVVGVMRKY